MTGLWGVLQKNRARFVGEEALPEVQPESVQAELLAQLSLKPGGDKRAYTRLGRAVQQLMATTVAVPKKRGAGLAGKGAVANYDEEAWLTLLFQTFGAERPPQASQGMTPSLHYVCS